MTLHPDLPAERTSERRLLRIAGILVRGLPAAVVVGLFVLLPFAHWTVELRMVEYIVPWLLRPSTGYLSLVLVLWIVFSLPGALRLLAGVAPSITTSAKPRTASRKDSDADQLPDPIEAEEIWIPAASVGALGSAHRWEMAEALGIPWRDELIHDGDAWRSACEDAVESEAAARGR